MATVTFKDRSSFVSSCTCVLLVSVLIEHFPGAMSWYVICICDISWPLLLFYAKIPKLKVWFS